MPKSKLTLIPYILAFLVISCNDSKHEEIAAVPKDLKTINFFLETSASMEGYLRGGAEFSKIIPNLLVEIENKVSSKSKTININYISDSILKYPKTTRDFIHDISTTNVTKSKSSEMHKIFEMVTNKTDSNDISIFVSDCILSYPDSNIKKDPEINKRNADGELKAFIKDAFLKIKRRNVCASLYGFNSKFFSTYYTYQNGKIPLNGEIKRPFYIWVIGDKELLQHFNKQLLAIESFNPELIVDFGMFEKPIDTYNILFKTDRYGKWATNETEITEIEITKTNPIKFTISLDLSLLPKYAQDTGYLKKNLKASCKDAVGKIVDVKRAKDLDISKAASHEKEFLQNASHAISIEISDMYKSQAQISLQLPLKYNTEYIDWSIMDDKVKAVLDGKTFAFQYLVDGVKEAYQNNDNFIKIAITLKK